MSLKDLLRKAPETEMSEPKITESKAPPHPQLVGYDPFMTLEAYKENLKKAEARVKRLQDEVLRLEGELANTEAVAESMRKAVEVLSQIPKAKLVPHQDIGNMEEELDRIISSAK